MRIEDDPHGVGARAGADGQLGVVRDGGAGPDDHRVGQGAQPVQVAAVLLAGDVVGVAGAGGDETVQALAELGDGQPGTGQAQREVAVGQEPGLRRGGLAPPPSAVRAPDQTGGPGAGLGPDRSQPLPRRFRLQEGHDASSPVPTRARYSAKESTSPARSSFPLSADARDGRPMTPDSV